MSAVGSTIAGYRLDREVGRGGMATVYQAYDERLNRNVALKLLAPELAEDAAFRARFIRESRAAAAVDHRNIIPIYEAGEAGGELFIAMRFAPGGDVRSLLERSGPLPPGRAYRIIAQVAAALDAAHRHGLVHRDVKPGNMLLEEPDGPSAGPGPRAEGAGAHVYLSDFGVSKVAVSTGLTLTGQVVGTLDYIAPEQIEGREVDGRTDQYSLACAAFELLCGSPPFQQHEGLAVLSAQLSEPVPSAAARRPGLPAGADRVLARALAKNPAGRYASCAEFAADLGRALGVAAAGVAAAGAATAVPRAGVPGAGAPGAAVPGPPGDATLLPGAAASYPGYQPAAYPGAQDPAAPYPAAQYPAAQYPAAQYPAAQYPAAQYPAPQHLAAQHPAAQYPGYQDGPASYPGAGGPGRPRRRGRKGLAAAGAAVAIVAAVAVVFALRPSPRPGPNAARGSASPSATPASASPGSPASTAAGQARSVNVLLDSSSVSRQTLQAQINDIEACANVTGAQGKIQGITSQRQTEYSQAQGLATGALPDGAQLKSDLVAALRDSLTADQGYLAWARQEQAGCTPGSGSQSADYGSGVSASEQATPEKDDFVALWNPVAAQYGYPPRQPGQI